MKLVVVALVLVSSCKSERAPAPAVGSAYVAPVTPAVDTCEIATRALDAVTCTSPDGTKLITQAKQTLAGTLDIARKSSSAEPGALQTLCARMIQAVVHDASSNGCSVPLADADRKQIGIVLDAWYAKRTPVVATGSGAADAVIGRIVVIRDAMCACVDQTCLTKVDGQLDTIGALPKDAPPAASDLGSKLLDDVSRCEAQIRFGKP